jgi:hypothetical protein
MIVAAFPPPPPPPVVGAVTVGTTVVGRAAPCAKRGPWLKMRPINAEVTRDRSADVRRRRSEIKKNEDMVITKDDVDR